MLRTCSPRSSITSSGVLVGTFTAKVMPGVKVSTCSAGVGFSAGSATAGGASAGGCTSSGTDQVLKSSGALGTGGGGSSWWQLSNRRTRIRSNSDQRILFPPSLRGDVKGRHAQPQPIVHGIRETRELDAAHRKGPGPERLLHHGRVAFRAALDPQHLIARRRGRFRDTLQLDRHQLLPHLKRLLFVLDALEQPPRLSTRMPIDPGPLLL